MREDTMTKTDVILNILIAALIAFIVYMVGPGVIFLAKDIARMWVKAWNY